MAQVRYPLDFHARFHGCSIYEIRIHIYSGIEKLRIYNTSMYWNIFEKKASQFYNYHYTWFTDIVIFRVLQCWSKVLWFHKPINRCSRRSYSKHVKDIWYIINFNGILKQLWLWNLIPLKSPVTITGTRTSPRPQIVEQSSL